MEITQGILLFSLPPMLALPASGPDRKKLWLALWPAILLPLIGALVYFVMFPGTVLGRAIYGVDKVLLFFWPFLATRWILGQRLSRECPARGNLLSSLVTGTAFGALAVGLMWFLLNHSAYFGGRIADGVPMIRQRIADMGVLEHYLAFGVFLSLVNSALEEFFWRWFVYGNLRHVTRPALAHLGAAVAFSLHHFVVLDQFFSSGFAFLLSLCVGCGGLVWSLLYARYGTVWGSWLSHAMVDIGFLALAYPLIFAPV